MVGTELGGVGAGRLLEAAAGVAVVGRRAVGRLGLPRQEGGREGGNEAQVSQRVAGRPGGGRGGRGGHPLPGMWEPRTAPYPG